MLQDLKISLRIKNDTFNNEIEDLVDAAKIELKISGVNKIDIEDPLIKRAIFIYVKAHFGWNNPDSEKLQHSFDMLKQHLALSGDYNAVQ